MKKKVFMMLPCIAAVAIATYVGEKTFESHANDTSNLLMQNVEALSQRDGSVFVTLWKNSHVPLMRYNVELRMEVATDSVKGISDARVCTSEEKIRKAKHEGYRYTSHIHNFKVCNVDLSKIQ